jgi:hypothetical protein
MPGYLRHPPSQTRSWRPFREPAARAPSAGRSGGEPARWFGFRLRSNVCQRHKMQRDSRCVTVSSKHVNSHVIDRSAASGKTCVLLRLSAEALCRRPDSGKEDHGRRN